MAAEALQSIACPKECRREDMGRMDAGPLQVGRFCGRACVGVEDTITRVDSHARRPLKSSMPSTIPIISRPLNSTPGPLHIQRQRSFPAAHPMYNSRASSIL